MKSGDDGIARESGEVNADDSEKLRVKLHPDGAGCFDDLIVPPDIVLFEVPSRAARKLQVSGEYKVGSFDDLELPVSTIVVEQSMEASIQVPVGTGGVFDDIELDAAKPAANDRRHAERPFTSADAGADWVGIDVPAAAAPSRESWPAVLATVSENDSTIDVAEYEAHLQELGNDELVDEAFEQKQPELQHVAIEEIRHRLNDDEPVPDSAGDLQ